MVNSSSRGESPLRSPRHISLDGRTLEGGGQLVRNALALSALTSKPVTIDQIRGNRGRGGGLKGSHAAAVKLLAEIGRSKVTGGEVGSQKITFEPEAPASEVASSSTPRKSSLVSLENLSVQPEYKIQLSTPGSVFLIFQALYPYLLHAGSRAATDYIKVTITGGTNGTSAPSYDYASQVMAPNFARLGLPPLSISLHKRGWTVGPIEMGSVNFLIHPLSSSKNERGILDTCFPQINIMDYERRKIIRIDVTVLAPDTVILNEKRTVRAYIEEETHRSLRKAFQALDSSIFEIPADDNLNREKLPIKIHTSERTNHASQIYVLLVAHTSTGLRIGKDTLISSGKSQGPPKKKQRQTKNGPKQNDKGGNRAQDEADRLTHSIDGLVEGFLKEISDPGHDKLDQSKSGFKKRSVLDTHMRDQIVVFEALGEVHGKGDRSQKIPAEENEKYWSLHTRTAQWVCQRMLFEIPEEQS
ncbi:uncharacterized protein N7483_002712 [Penicillium malachiteum]|uniref:uncharacterized protein n=1 Tax=Penicillium malachiteum TaxID=1324776 RepID=UPI0025495651|nr:uncharacterized protein N7483_002712 [Penicillium malachiteum]KAJ5737587.1 hypothetical protein N7483_002712 [Penicillium malachiteum]